MPESRISASRVPKMMPPIVASAVSIKRERHAVVEQVRQRADDDVEVEVGKHLLSQWLTACGAAPIKPGTATRRSTQRMATVTTILITM